MNENRSFTPEEVAAILKISRYTVYEMIKRGDFPAYRIGRKMRIEEKDLNEYINLKKGKATTEKVVAETVPPKNEALIICGQDIVLDILTRHVGSRVKDVAILRNYVGSYNGLLDLYHGKANIATGHLWAADVNEYNIPYVQRLLPGVDAVVINLVFRMAGFYVQKDNPKKITDWLDLTRSEITFVNREKGCGARVLVDEYLKKLEINRRLIQGYNNEEMSHLAIASAVARGDADVGVGIEKVAMQVDGIDFIPLQKERYDMIIRAEDIEKPHFKELLSVIRSNTFKQEVTGMGHYDVSQMGEMIAKV